MTQTTRSTLDYFKRGDTPYGRVYRAIVLGQKKRREEQRRFNESNGPWLDLGGEG